MSTLYVGVDPGGSGGFGIIPPTPGHAWCQKMPETEADIWQFVENLNWHREHDTVVACIESVHSMPKQGVASSFTFGQNFGALRMALTAAKFKWHLVTPQKWQKAMGCMTRGDKNVSKAHAQRLFPHLKLTHATADAMLIAEYCRLNFT